MLAYASDGTLLDAEEWEGIIVSEDGEEVQVPVNPLKFSDFTYDEASGVYVSDMTDSSEYDYKGHYEGAEVTIDESNTKRNFRVTVGADKKLATISYEEETTKAVRGREDEVSIRYTTKTTIFLYDYGTTEITEQSGVEKDQWEATTSEDNYRNVTITLTTTTDGGKTSEKQVWKVSDGCILVENQEGTQKYVGEDAHSDFNKKYKVSIGNLRNIVSKAYPWGYVYNPYEDVYQLGRSMSGYGEEIDGQLTNAIKDSQRVDGVKVQSIITDVRITLGENGLLEKVTYTIIQAEEGSDSSTAVYEYVWEFSDYGTTVVPMTAEEKAVLALDDLTNSDNFENYTLVVTWRAKYPVEDGTTTSTEITRYTNEYTYCNSEWTFVDQQYGGGGTTKRTNIYRGNRGRYDVRSLLRPDLATYVYDPDTNSYYSKDGYVNYRGELIENIRVTPDESGRPARIEYICQETASDGTVLESEEVWEFSDYGTTEISLTEQERARLALEDLAHPDNFENYTLVVTTKTTTEFIKHTKERTYRRYEGTVVIDGKEQKVESTNIIEASDEDGWQSRVEIFLRLQSTTYVYDSDTNTYFSEDGYRYGRSVRITNIRVTLDESGKIARIECVRQVTSSDGNVLESEEVWEFSDYGTTVVEEE